MITQRASSSGIRRAKPSRIAWSSAPRLGALEMVSVTTPGADSVQSSSPPAALLEDNERLALRDRLPFFAANLLYDAGVLGFDGHFHLHRLENHDCVALFDG